MTRPEKPILFSLWAPPGSGAPWRGDTGAYRLGTDWRRPFTAIVRAYLLALPPTPTEDPMAKSQKDPRPSATLYSRALEYLEAHLGLQAAQAGLGDAQARRDRAAGVLVGTFVRDCPGEESGVTLRHPDGSTWFVQVSTNGGQVRAARVLSVAP